MPADFIAYAALPYLLVSALFLGLAVLCYRRMPFYRTLTASHTSRYPGLDGLRGFLALGVFFHHSIIAYYEQTTGVWTNPPSAFYNLLGQSGVSVFFMITGFLFWDKALAGSRLRALHFYYARLRRLGPAYFFSMALICLVVALPLGTESLWSFGWKDLGKVLLFQGLPSSGKSFGVYWTLAWEWKFYLLLPLMAYIARRWYALLIAAIVIIHIELHPSHVFLFNFVCGAIAAWAIRTRPDLATRAPLLRDALGLAALVFTFAFFDTAQGYAQSMLLFLFFLSVVGGSSAFGILHSRAALLLGTISYSLYLQHCIVIYTVIRSINLYYPVASLTLGQYWLLVPLEGALVILLALFSYRYVEHPFMGVKPRTQLS